MSAENTEIVSGWWTIPAWKRNILGNVNTQGGERIQYRIKLVIKDDFSPLAVLIQPQSPELNLDPNLRFVMANQPIKLRLKIEEL